MTMDVLRWTAREVCHKGITPLKAHHEVRRNKAILINVVVHHKVQATTGLLAKMVMETQRSMIRVDMELPCRRHR